MLAVYLTGIPITLVVIFWWFLDKGTRNAENNTMAVFLSLLWPLTLAAFLANLAIDKFL